MTTLDCIAMPIIAYLTDGLAFDCHFSVHFLGADLSVLCTIVYVGVVSTGLSRRIEVVG